MQMGRECQIPGVKWIKHPNRSDPRGCFTKLLHPSDLGLEPSQFFPVRECFVSWSEPGVLRGMHFQVPPSDHDKAVSCLSGQVLDVVLDLRRSSPTYGLAHGFELSGREPSTVWIPAGCAHGFAVLGTERALMHYAVTKEHVAVADQGVRWDSFGFEWPCGVARIVSERDRGLPVWVDLPPLFP